MARLNFFLVCFSIVQIFGNPLKDNIKNTSADGDLVDVNSNTKENAGTVNLDDDLSSLVSGPEPGSGEQAEEILPPSQDEHSSSEAEGHVIPAAGPSSAEAEASDVLPPAAGQSSAVAEEANIPPPGDFDAGYYSDGFLLTKSSASDPRDPPAAGADQPAAASILSRDPADVEAIQEKLEDFEIFEKTTFNPLDNLQDFAALQLANKNKNPNTEFHYDQLAVESDANLNQQNVSHVVVSTDFFSGPEAEEESEIIKHLLSTVPSLVGEDSFTSSLEDSDDSLEEEAVHVRLSTKSSVSQAVTKIIASTSTESVPEFSVDIHSFHENPRFDDNDDLSEAAGEIDAGTAVETETRDSSSYLTEFVHTPGTLSIIEVHPTTAGSSAAVETTERGVPKVGPEDTRSREPEVGLEDIRSRVSEDTRSRVPKDWLHSFLIKAEDRKPSTEATSLVYDHSFILSEDFPTTSSGDSAHRVPEVAAGNSHYGFEINKDVLHQHHHHHQPEEEHDSHVHHQPDLSSDLYDVVQDQENEDHHDQHDHYEDHVVYRTQKDGQHHGHDHVVHHDHSMNGHPHQNFNAADDEDDGYESFIHHLEDIGMHREIIESAQGGGRHPDIHHPLVSLMHIEPHAMKVRIKPKAFQPKIMIRLLYERVPRIKTPHMEHLDDPVIEFFPLYKEIQEFGIENLPKGKYIVCAEAQIEGSIIQNNCFETLVDRLDNNMLQSGVIAVIAVAIFIVFSVILYAVYYRIHNIRKKKKEKKLEAKVTTISAKQAKIAKSSTPESYVTFSNDP